MEVSRRQVIDHIIVLGSSGPCQSESSCVKDTVRAIRRTLDDAGGPCRASGVFSLVRTLASIAEFDAAVWVIEETARRASYYNALMAAKCKAGDFQGACEVFDEMTNSGCDPKRASSSRPWRGLNPTSRTR